ncbi:MHYT domain-containing protein [Coleofasciculus sp. E1-EBD-02]|uniref:MHYT domain-containing protein n=1 Tax=Coleofasciculus sp. E1-EBD-02 TaxID=3068481 RepID=UPI0032F4758C
MAVKAIDIFDLSQRVKRNLTHTDTTMTATYNFNLVLLSIAIAIIASYTALDRVGRVTVAKGRTSQLWLAGGAVAMGIGIWSMHFIGMLAYNLPIPISYNLSRVWVSLLVGILGSGVALWLGSRPHIRWLQLLLGSVFMGLGIAAMHYTGMMAMKLEAVADYNLTLVAVSIAVAIAASFIALGLAFQLRHIQADARILPKLASAIVMGLAISGMHYIGMAAVRFQGTDSIVLPSSSMIDNLWLARFIAVATLFILALPLIVSLFDQRLNVEKAKAETLRQSEERFRALLQNASDFITVVTGEGMIRYTSPSLPRVLGYDTEDWQGKTIGEFVLNDDNPIADSLLTQALDSPNANVTVELRLPNASGEVREFEVIANNLLRLPSVAGIVLTYHDITDCKQTFQALQASEQEAHSLAQREALLNYLGREIRNSLDVNTILDTAVFSVRSLLNLDRCQFLWRTPDGGKPSIAITHEARKSGLPSRVGYYSNPEVISLIQSIQDLEMIQINDVTKDPDLNTAQRQLLTRSQVTAQLILPLKTNSGQIGALVCTDYREPHTWSQSEVELLTAVVDQLAIAIDQAQLYASAHSTATTATAQAKELQQTLQKLQQTQAQLIQSEKMSSLGQMIAGITHELNNPVSFIYGNIKPAHQYAQDLLRLLKLYQQYYPEPPAAIQEQAEAMNLEFVIQDFPKLLGSLKMGAVRIRDLVKSLRNFCRLDEADVKPMDIHQGIENTLLILGNRLKAKENHAPIEIIKQYGQLPQVECYGGQLNQVFMNLLDNAIDALDDQSPPLQITISTEVLEETDQVRIRIQDTGSGIPEDVKTHLFDPFFTTKPVGQGTGLGLSISYQIVVETHKGTLQCFSQLGEGTEFCIDIPISQTQGRNLGDSVSPKPLRETCEV